VRTARVAEQVQIGFTNVVANEVLHDRAGIAERFENSEYIGSHGRLLVN